MNRTTQSKCAAALCIVVLAGCASDRMSDSTSSSNGYTTSGMSSASGSGTSGSGTSSGGASGTGSMSSTGTSGSTSSNSTDSSAANSSSGTTGSTGTGSSTYAQSGSPASTSSSTQQTSYGVVQAIDQMQRQDVTAGTVGAAAVGGSTTGTPKDKVYRVTVRMDDGSSQMVVVDSMPSYKIGDRIRYNNGTVVAY